MARKTKAQLESLVPEDELIALIQEATQTVEDQLRLEDEGWINLSSQGGAVISDAARITNLNLSRLYSTKDPLGKQAIRLWTDYTFGPGMTWQAEDDKVFELLKGVWDDKANQCTLSARGQRRSSNKLLIDGEVFFAIFLGKGEARVRTIDPLEIAEIITAPDDIESPQYYRRNWADRRGKPHDDYYRSTVNIKGEPCLDTKGGSVNQTADALVYHITFDSISQRGNPLLLPALDWIRQYRRFLASRVAVMLALARFAWKTKVKGGQATVDAIKATTHQQEVAAGSQLLENLGSDTMPIKTDSGARGAYDDGRMLKLQVCAAVGIPEQYFGDISIGNLATAKTVELPLQKMFESYQQVWADSYKDINEIILEHNKVDKGKWYVDMDFPPVAPEDVALAAKAIVDIVGVFPAFVDSPDVQQIALMTIGVNDPAEVLDALGKENKGNTEARLINALKQFRESLKK